MPPPGHGYETDHSEPNRQEPDWASYEQHVFKLFSTTGFPCERNVVMAGLRTSHQVDVVVRAPSFGKVHLWVVECKKTGRRASKQQAVALKSVMEDVGASHGYLICDAGFQRGVQEYASQNNITAITSTELDEELQRKQIATGRRRAQDLTISLAKVYEDKGNWDAGCDISVESNEGKPLADRIVEVIIFKHGHEEHAWRFTPAEARFLRSVERSKITISLPGDASVYGNASFDSDLCTLDGIEASGYYTVVVRTTSGPLSVEGVVPPYK